MFVNKFDKKTLHKYEDPARLSSVIWQKLLEIIGQLIILR